MSINVNIEKTMGDFCLKTKFDADIGITANFVKNDFNFSIGGVHRFNTVNGDAYNVTTSVGWKF